MNSKLRRFKIKNVVWYQDKDDDTILPKNFEVVVNDYGDTKLNELIGDTISYDYGYCPYRFDYEEIIE